MKVCSKCGEEKELEEFHKRKRSKDGLQPYCKVCIRETKKQWYEENKDRVRENAKRWREENKDRVRENAKQWYEENKGHKREYDKRWYEENKERQRETSKRWYEENKERQRETKKRWYEENKDRVREYGERWREENPEKVRTRNATRRARKLGNLDEWDRELSAARRLAIENDPCYYCGQRTETMHDEHYLPLSKGGTDEWFNLVRACSTCNQSKYTKCGTVFMIQEGII